MLKPYYVIVTGGRRYGDQIRVNTELNEVRLSVPNDQTLVIVQGDARGADYLAKEWASTMGLPYFSFPAQWNKLGPGAGHIRNREMLEAIPIQRVIAFPGGVGTASMVQLAEKAGVPVTVIPGECPDD